MGGLGIRTLTHGILMDDDDGIHLDVVVADAASDAALVLLLLCLTRTTTTTSVL